jgi:hypothetical protein
LPSISCALSRPTREQHDDVDRDNDHEYRECEQEQHAARLPTRLFLMGEEIHSANAASALTRGTGLR